MSTATKPCASCPFLPTNFKEFGEVAKKLCEKFKQPEPNFWAQASIRESVKKEAIENRRLQCHSTVYDGDMEAHPEESKPCAGLRIYLEGQDAGKKAKERK